MIINDSIRINESNITLKTLQDAKGSEDFMKDRASVHIDNNKLVFVKLGKNKWEKATLGAHAISGTYSDQEVFDACQKSKNVKFYNESIMNESNRVILKKSNGYEILVANNGAITAVSCFNYYGEPSDYTAETIYKDLYPKKKVDYVDKKNGYVELRMSVDDAAKEVKRICPGYQIYRKD